jgi:uncharacterized cupin superfamily protein
MISEMKKFALFLANAEQAKIVEGNSATVTRKPDGLRVVISVGNKRQIFNEVICFCEVSEKITFEK